VSTKPRWFALHVRSNQERVIAEYLEAREIELFFPTYRTPSSRCDRKTTLVRPLFTGYLFVRVSLDSPKRVEVLKAPGAVRLIGFDNTPLPVPDETIESLKILVGNGADTARPHPLIKEGRKVIVMTGPFVGASGVLAMSDTRKHQLVVEVEFLGRAVMVPISPEQIKPIL